MDKINYLFYSVSKYGYYVRKYKLDGQTSWDNLKAQIIPLNIEFAKWSDQSLTFFDNLTALGVINIKQPHMTHSLWERHHFLIQHGNLPKKESNLIRLLQIAYNSGQLTCCLENDNVQIYTKDMIKYYMDNNLYNISTYVDPATLLITAEHDKITNWISEFIKGVKTEKYGQE